MIPVLMKATSLAYSRPLLLITHYMSNNVEQLAAFVNHYE